MLHFDGMNEFFLIGVRLGLVVLAAVVMVRALLRDLRHSVAPHVAIPRDVSLKALAALEIKPNDRVLELGCGRARVLFDLAERSGIYGTGIELDPWLFLFTWIRARMRFGGRVKILYGNLFDLDLSSYNKVYGYLMKRAYPKLQEKFARELPSGSLVVLAGWPFEDTSSGHQIVKKGEERIYVYRY